MSKTLEELGYEKVERWIGNTRFHKEGTNIDFDEKYKTFSCFNGYGEFAPITMEELKAIYKYCEDNKWI